MLTLGRKILNLRLDRGLDQLVLAAQCGLSQSTLSKIERDVNSPDATTLFAIARALHVPFEYLVDESMPYPYVPPERPSRRRRGPKKVWLSAEEVSVLEAARASVPMVMEVAAELPYASLELLSLCARVLPLSGRRAARIHRELRRFVQ